MEINISLIKIANRYRKDLGDIFTLAQSIDELGQLQPIGIDSNYRLIFGERRIKAMQHLGREIIEGNVIHLESLVSGEYAENEIRKDFTVSERVEIARAVEEELGERRGRDNVQNIAQLKGQKSIEIAAEKSGFNNKETYRQAKKIVEDGAPELIEKVDQGKVSISAAANVATLNKEEQSEIVARGEKEILEAAKQIRQEKSNIRRNERIEKIHEISQGNTELNTDKTYPVIYADPPWRYDYSATDSRKIENQYPTMNLAEICCLPVLKLAAQDSILFLWATSPKLTESIEVLNAWGFDYKTCAVWDKQRMGMGYYFRQQHEILLVATKGNIPVPPAHTRISSVISIDRKTHSSKPELFYQIIEEMYPDLSKIELFCRSPREGWESWGNQSNAT